MTASSRHLFAALAACLVAACGAGPAASMQPSLSPTASAVPAAPSIRPTPTPVPTEPPILAPTATLALPTAIEDVIPGDDDALYAHGGRTILRIDPRTGGTTTVATLDADRWDLNIGFGSAWVSRGTDDDTRGWIERYDLATGREIVEIDVQRSPVESVTAFGSIWVPNHHSSTVSRIDPATNRVAATITIGTGTTSIVSLGVGAGRVWVVGARGLSVAAIDPATNAVVDSFTATGALCRIGVFQALVLVHPCGRGQVLVYDPATRTIVGRLPIGANAVWNDSALWLLTPASDRASFVLTAFDLASMTSGPAVTIESGPGGGFALGSFWLGKGKQLLRFDLAALPTL
jgi:YVTN family beta-propeller protein